MDYSGGPATGGVFSMFGQAAQQLSQQDQAQQQQQAGPSSAAAFDWEDPNATAGTTKALDLVFIMDCTGSMGSYIASATKNIETICDNIITSERLSAPGALRIGLVAFRDHPPQDYTYVTKNFGFTSDVGTIKEHLKELYASGGGDGPEAVTAALHSTLLMDWRENATRLAVLIADAPPHGIGEYGDGFSDGSPDGQDPLQLCRTMAQSGITLFMVACEPALSGYSYAADFYQGLVRITSGLLVPLTTASLLTHAIIAAAGEAMALDRLHREVGDEVAERLKSLSLEAAASNNASSSNNNASDLMDQVARDLHQRLLLRNESTKQLVIESIYRDSEDSRRNIEIWSTASDVKTARPHIVKITGSRLSDKYLRTRQASSSFTSHAPFPRSVGAARSTMEGGGSSWDSVSGFSGGRNTAATASTSSPSRKVVSSFSTFSASPGMSFGNAKEDKKSLSPSFGSSAAFSGPRFDALQRPSQNSPRGGMRGGGGMMDDDDDDEDDAKHDEGRPLPVAVETDEGQLEVAGEDGSKLMFRQGAISLDQAKRLAMASAWRGGLI